MTQLNNVNFKYSTNLILEDVTTEFTKNITVIVGESGSGKSTLALTLNVINKISSGEIKVLDYEVTPNFNLKKNKLIRKDIAYVWQLSDTQLFKTNVYEELIFNLSNFKVNVDDYKAEVLKYLTIFNLPINILTMSPYHLSGGQKKKIAIISAILQQPKILILDEPTISLDPKSKKELITILKSLNMKLIIITHDNELLNILDSDSEVIKLENKKLIKFETIKQYIQTNFDNNKFKLIPLKYHYGNILGVSFEQIYNTSSEYDFVQKFGDICKIN